MGKQITHFLIIGLLLVLTLLNFILVFTPEIGFDALWYHLTLPRIFLESRSWFVPGGLLYYSVLPRLFETISIPLIQFSGFIGPKLIQFLSGVLVNLMIYNLIVRRTGDKYLAIIGVSLFYGTWVVSWQSGSAYLDLFRTLLEFGAIYFYFSTTGLKKIILPSIFLGLALGTKHHALFSLFLFATFIDKRVIPIAVLLGLPWYLLSYHFTGNPVYPLFTIWMQDSQLQVMGEQFYQPLSLIFRLFTLPWHFTLPYDDFISPVLGLVFLLLLIQFIQKKSSDKLLAFSLVGMITCFFLPPPSSRYLIPFIPGVVVSLVSHPFLSSNRFRQLFAIVATLSIFSIVGMRMIAMKKYLPYLLHQQTQNEFLTSLSNRLPLTFIDSDGFVESLPKEANYLIDKLHNLYYFPHHLNHTSWVGNTANFDYLITIGADPKNTPGQLIHTNQIGIQVFKL